MQKFAATDIFWMRRALALADSVMNITTPNPRVGCVIIRDGRKLGEGATQEAGGPHAEICALHDAVSSNESVAGSTLYVTLEPCNHYGRTPPCVDAIIAARPARVVIAMRDPNPLVNGGGLARLQAAGIEVTTGVCADEALAQNAGFVSRMTRGTPWLWLKLASSLDGRSALHNGASQWITRPAARDDGHTWRARSCAVLTGVGTILADDPLLTPRAVETSRTPLRIIIDSRLRTPPEAQIFDGEPVLIFTALDDPAGTAAARLQARNARIISMPDREGRVDLPGVLQWLGQHDINEVHVEAGATLSGALLRAGLVDEIVHYMAPILLGDARPIVELPALDQLPAQREFEFTSVVPVGDDIRIRARRIASWEPLCKAVGAQSVRPEEQTSY